MVVGFAAGAALLATFIWWESRTPAPIVPMRLFRSRTFSAINVAGLLMFLGAFGSIFLLTQLLQFIQGYSPQEAGLRMLPWTAMPLLVAPLSGILADRLGGRPILITGFLSTAAGLGWLAVVAEPDVGYLSQVPAFVLCGVGMAMFFAPSGAILMGAVADAEQGIASGVHNALREVGGALGVALLASVFTAHGGYETPQAFVDGLVPALWVGVTALTAASAATLIVSGGPAATAPREPASLTGEAALAKLR